MAVTKVFIASDHGGFELKEFLRKSLASKFEIEDLGPLDASSCDYPDYAVKVGNAVASLSGSAGIMIDGAGIGSSMALNKIPGILAACCNDLYTARNARCHNNANVLTLGSMVIGPGKALQVAELFLDSNFEGGRHAGRVGKILDLDGIKFSIPGLSSLITNILETLGWNNLLKGGADLPKKQNNAKVPSAFISEEQLKLRIRQSSDQKTCLLQSKEKLTPLAADYARDNGIRLEMV